MVRVGLHHVWLGFTAISREDQEPLFQWRRHCALRGWRRRPHSLAVTEGRRPGRTVQQ